MVSKNVPKKNKTSSLPSQPMYKLLPNMVTISGMCIGLFSLKAGLVGHWEKAVYLLLIAGILDGLDGKVARLFNASSSFGAQLDSLADFLNFGVVPALLVYFWKTHEIKGVGWAVALFFIVCQALRLARYNAKLSKKTSPKVPYFEGVAAPMGATLSVFPMMLTFLQMEEFPALPFELTSQVIVVYILCVALLMVSQIPTISLKGIHIHKQYHLALLAGGGFFVIMAITVPWLTFSLVCFVYLISIPIFWIRVRKYNR